jgi:hypothetical protein
MLDVVINPENFILPLFAAGMFFAVERLEYPQEYFIRLLSVQIVQLVLLHLRNNAVIDWNWQESDHYEAVHSGHLADLQR